MMSPRAVLHAPHRLHDGLEVDTGSGIVVAVFDHVTIAARDRSASERFYDTVLATLGLAKDESGELYAEWGEFSLRHADKAGAITRRLHIGFRALSRAHVDEFWRAGTKAGYRDDGPPGPRPQYLEDYYGGFLLDPDGNSAEAVHYGSMPGGSAIDHLWIRVADVAASKRFYETIAPHAGIRPAIDTPERTRFVGRSSSFSLVSGTATENVHMAFPASDDSTVDTFHRVAVTAGYRDNGAPAERPIYHPGYYGAYVLDPDGNNIELVNHNRP
jgi:catechol 2,3-dioxygenase-like lactoylglutathione lyase family enzyme